MTKQEVQQRVLQNGKPIELDLFKWDEKTNTFISTENNLVLDFNGISNCTFKTGSDCIFNTDSHCTFFTHSHCTFNTYFNCKFTTGSNCTFNTYSNCTFKTYANCTFKTKGNKCVIIRRDILEVIQLHNGSNITLHSNCVKGYIDNNC